MTDYGHVTVILTARNDRATVGGIAERPHARLPGAQIIVVDDGSTDHTAGAAQADLDDATDERP